MAVQFKTDTSGGSYSTAIPLVADGTNSYEINLKGKWLQINFTNDTSSSATGTISEISIIYREKTLK